MAFFIVWGKDPNRAYYVDGNWDSGVKVCMSRWLGDDKGPWYVELLDHKAHRAIIEAYAQAGIEPKVTEFPAQKSVRDIDAENARRKHRGLPPLPPDPPEDPDMRYLEIKYERGTRR